MVNVDRNTAVLFTVFFPVQSQGFPASVDGQELQNTFAAFGQVLSVKIVKNEEGRSLRYGYIQYATPEASTHAIAQANGMIMGSDTLVVEKFVPKTERDKSRPGFTNVYVRNFPTSIDSEQSLKNLFSEFGEISSVFLAQAEDGSLKGFGFVNFSSHEAAQRAVETMNEKRMGNKKLYVAAAQTKEERSRILAGWIAEKQQAESKMPACGETVVVKNLPYSTNEVDLRSLFQQFGKILVSKIALMRDGKSRGFGFVHFENLESAHKAVQEMHLSRIGGRRVSVSLGMRKGGGGGAMNPASPPTPAMMPNFQYQQPCFPGYQYPVPSQGSQEPPQAQNGFANLSMGMAADGSPAGVRLQPISEELNDVMFQHGVGGMWNQPYYWPSNGAGGFSNMLGQSAPYTMMGVLPVGQGGVGPAGH
ncbi:hypothetical protein BSKO_03967 [Bryopsis sp. KO-2023]|nr:hypothetical protein BSKO_03967 [Bryopsis sp. KO-2023]